MTDRLPSLDRDLVVKLPAPPPPQVRGRSLLADLGLFAAWFLGLVIVVGLAAWCLHRFA